MVPTGWNRPSDVLRVEGFHGLLDKGDVLFGQRLVESDEPMIIATCVLNERGSCEFFS
jgi:hypothetical protein